MPGKGIEIGNISVNTPLVTRENSFFKGHKSYLIAGILCISGVVPMLVGAFSGNFISLAVGGGIMAIGGGVASCGKCESHTDGVDKSRAEKGLHV